LGPDTAFTASAWILDAITDVDAKFALIMEREYETLSAELRKWFKRLAVCGFLASSIDVD
jgi:hypothetical protein